MIISNDRKQMRQMYFDVWSKHQNNSPLEDIEQQILAVIIAHPEYHSILSQPQRYMDRDYLPEFGEVNPFMHMGLHLGIGEQLSTNRPKGIAKIYQQLLSKHQDRQSVEHMMMECLVEGLWKAQRNNTMPDEKQYLKKLKRLLK